VRAQMQKRAPPGESPCLQERVHGKKTRGTGLLPPGVKYDGPGNFPKILPGEGKGGDIKWEAPVPKAHPACALGPGLWPKLRNLGERAANEP